MILCLPTAPLLPIGGSGDFGTSPFYGQLSDKPLLVLCTLLGVPDVKDNSGSQNQTLNTFLPSGVAARLAILALARSDIDDELGQLGAPHQFE